MTSSTNVTQSTGVYLDLPAFVADIVDTGASSTYFNITELPDTLTSGKNCIAVNGSDLLKTGSQIKIEVLDVNGNPLYIEIASAPSQYRYGVASLVAIYVYDTTPIGLGQINIVGTLANGKSVKWNKSLAINPALPNTTTVRFYTTPTFSVTPSVDVVLYFSGSYLATDTGSVSGQAVIPPVGSNYYTFDSLRHTPVYQINLINGPEFKSNMVGQPISFIASSSNNTLISASSIVSEVINNKTLLLQTPLFYPNVINNQTVVNFASASYQITYLSPPQSSVSQSFSANLNVTSSKAIASVQIGNLDTFSGNVYRLRLYRKSLNSGYDSECIADEILKSNEEFIDRYYPDGFRNRIGFFNSQAHITGTDGYGYWEVTGSASGSTQLLYDSNYIIDGMYISGSPSFQNPNLEKRLVVRSYNNNSLHGDLNLSPSISGSLGPANCLKLYANVQYIMTFNMVGFKPPKKPATKGQVDFYLRDDINGSTQDQSVSTNFDGYGIKVGSVVFPKEQTYQNFQTQTFLFTLNKSVEADLHIVPYFGDYIISQISIKAYQAFSFSPSLVNINIPVSVTIANEIFQITAEIFDINSKQIPTPNFTTIQAFDPNGLTILSSQQQVGAALEVNVPVSASHATNALSSSYSNQSNTANSSNSAISASYSANAVNSLSSNTSISASYANYTSLANSSATAISASYALTSSISSTASLALLAIDALTSISASTAALAISSSYAISASYTDTASIANSSSYADTASYILNSSTTLVGDAVGHNSANAVNSALSGSISFVNFTSAWSGNIYSGFLDTNTPMYCLFGATAPVDGDSFDYWPVPNTVSGSSIQIGIIVAAYPIAGVYDTVNGGATWGHT